MYDTAMYRVSFSFVDKHRTMHLKSLSLKMPKGYSPGFVKRHAAQVAAKFAALTMGVNVAKVSIHSLFVRPVRT